MQTKAKVMAAIYSLVFIALGALIVATALGWTVLLDQFQTTLNDPAGRWIVGLVGCLVILIALLIMYFSLKSDAPAEPGVIQELRLGRVVTTTAAIESVVRRAVRQIRGVKEVRPDIFVNPEGLNISLSVVLTPDVRVLEVTPQIQESVKDQISDIIGVNVPEVKIRVENIGYDAKARVE